MTKFEALKELGSCPCRACGGLGKHKKHICPSCNKLVTEFKDKLSKREFKISGLCQKCQDQTFNKKKALFTKKLATILLVQNKLLPSSVLGVKDLKDKI